MSIFASTWWADISYHIPSIDVCWNELFHEETLLETEHPWNKRMVPPIYLRWHMPCKANYWTLAWLNATIIRSMTTLQISVRKKFARTVRKEDILYLSVEGGLVGGNSPSVLHGKLSFGSNTKHINTSVHMNCSFITSAPYTNDRWILISLSVKVAIVDEQFDIVIYAINSSNLRFASIKVENNGCAHPAAKFNSDCDPTIDSMLACKSQLPITKLIIFFLIS